MKIIWKLEKLIYVNAVKKSIYHPLLKQNMRVILTINKNNKIKYDNKTQIIIRKAILIMIR